jgi:hypothetical protein
LPLLGGDVITFNYTNFFVGPMAKNVKFFHGQLDRYLRVDDRTTVSDSAALRATSSVESVAAFISGLRLDVSDVPRIDMPAIVPPIGFKPVMSREQLRTWAAADELLQRADQIIVVGYSFATADEHFNDLLRKSNTSARVVVVNPNLGPALIEAARVLGVDSASLVDRHHGEFEVRASRRLTGVNARGEDLDAALLEDLMR